MRKRRRRGKKLKENFFIKKTAASVVATQVEQLMS
jgi:hypothetical protein